ncbi:hypothetical protein O3P69_011716 [Scylla paramamosain]|uniref:Uncharacterized protein n=1 Tax=Scylla paramamosain TaxID=85552 RepID=A0AAW0SEM3_SCYPA
MVGFCFALPLTTRDQRDSGVPTGVPEGQWTQPRVPIPSLTSIAGADNIGALYEFLSCISSPRFCPYQPQRSPQSFLSPDHPLPLTSPPYHCPRLSSPLTSLQLQLSPPLCPLSLFLPTPLLSHVPSPLLVLPTFSHSQLPWKVHSWLSVVRVPATRVVVLLLREASAVGTHHK